MRIRRHPHQVLETFGLAMGSRYAFVSAHPSGGEYRDIDVHVTMRLMAGTLSDTVKQASQRGWDLPARRLGYGRKFLASLPLNALLDLSATRGAEIVTVHRDGWNETDDRGDHPTLTYWTAGHMGQHMGHGWDFAVTYLGAPEPEPKHPHHCIVVPERRWLADPALTWHSERERPEPDGESPADFERRMRAKRDNAMRGLFERGRRRARAAARNGEAGHRACRRRPALAPCGGTRSISTTVPSGTSARPPSGRPLRGA